MGITIGTYTPTTFARDCIVSRREPATALCDPTGVNCSASVRRPFRVTHSLSITAAPSGNAVLHSPPRPVAAGLNATRHYQTIIQPRCLYTTTSIRRIVHQLNLTPVSVGKSAPQLTGPWKPLGVQPSPLRRPQRGVPMLGCTNRPTCSCSFARDGCGRF